MMSIAAVRCAAPCWRKGTKKRAPVSAEQCVVSFVLGLHDDDGGQGGGDPLHISLAGKLCKEPHGDQVSNTRTLGLDAHSLVPRLSKENGGINKGSDAQ